MVLFSVSLLVRLNIFFTCLLAVLSSFPAVVLGFFKFSIWYMWPNCHPEISSNLYCHRQFVGLLHQVLSDIECYCFNFCEYPFQLQKLFMSGACLCHYFYLCNCCMLKPHSTEQRDRQDFAGVEIRKCREEVGNKGEWLTRKRVQSHISLLRLP